MSMSLRTMIYFHFTAGDDFSTDYPGPSIAEHAGEFVGCDKNELHWRHYKHADFK